VIDPDIRIGGFDAASWRRLLALFTPTASREGPEHGLFIVVQDGNSETIFARHTILGRVQGLPASDDPTVLRDAVPCRACVVINADALEQLDHRAALRLAFGQDYLEQLSMVAHALRETIQAGQIRVSPPLPETLPIPSGATITRALDLVLPVGRSAMLCTYEGSNIDTAILLRRGPRGIDTVLGPDWLAERVGPLGGDFRRDHHRIAETVATKLGELSIGVFAETATLHALLRSADPGAFATAAATRELVVSPMPPYAAVALGADAIRSVTRASGLGGVGRELLSAFAPVARALLEAVDARSVTSVLGFNPVLVLSAWLARREGAHGESAPDGDQSAEFFDSGASDP
jgi:hypothetical protein